MRKINKTHIVASHGELQDAEYAQWIAELIQRYRSAQVKAATCVNEEMLRFYWSIGEDMELRQMENRYGTRFYERVSRDLRRELGITQGLSPSTVKYARYFYLLYSPLITNRQQDVDDFNNGICQQGVDEFPELFRIPWSHHTQIIDKVKGDGSKGLFFVRKSLENNWGRGVLMNFLSSDLYERQGAAQTNFSLTLPAPEGDMAQQMLKSPYNFEFLQLKERYNEAELKDALMDKLVQFLLELGKGFSFVGREHRIVAGRKEKFIDLLFYIIPLHRYCVIEVKTTEFDFQDLGQLSGYVAIVNDTLNLQGDNPAIGLLICKEKDTVLAKYALSTTAMPIGISEYEVQTKQLPKDLRNALPSEKDIENRLNVSSEKETKKRYDIRSKMSDT